MTPAAMDEAKPDEAAAAVWYFATIHEPTRSRDVATRALAEGFTRDALAGARRTCGAATVWHHGEYWDLPDGSGRRHIPRRRGGAR